jgi:hypothetical protein
LRIATTRTKQLYLASNKPQAMTTKVAAPSADVSTSQRRGRKQLAKSIFNTPLLRGHSMEKMLESLRWIRIVQKKPTLVLSNKGFLDRSSALAAAYLSTELFADLLTDLL